MTYPIIFLSDSLLFKISTPSTFIDPDVGFNKPISKSIKVVFPDPVTPIMPIWNPLLIFKLILSKTNFSEPLYLKFISLSSILSLKSIDCACFRALFDEVLSISKTIFIEGLA